MRLKTEIKQNKQFCFDNTVFSFPLNSSFCEKTFLLFNLLFEFQNCKSDTDILYLAEFQRFLRGFKLILGGVL